MPREASVTDAVVLTSLESRGVRVSLYQLERWRTRGLVPRNPRRRLGRGRGTASQPADDLESSLETVAMANHGRGWDVEMQVLARMHDLAVRDEQGDEYDRLAERPVRKCLEHAILLKRPVPMGEDADEAYRKAHYLASVDWDLTWLPTRSTPSWGGASSREGFTNAELNTIRGAYEHVLAAEFIGVNQVGWDLVAESVTSLRWADARSIDTVVNYLNMVLNRRDDHLELACHVPYDLLLVAARASTRVLGFLGRFPSVPMQEELLWLSKLPRDYTWWPVLLMAMLMDRELLGIGQQFVAGLPAEPGKLLRRRMLEKHVVDMRVRFPDGLPPDPERKRTALVGLDEFMDLRTGKWRE